MYYKNMEIRYDDKTCIIAPICARLDEYKIKRLIKTINSESRQVGLDLKNLSECSIEFIESLKNLVHKDLGIFNIPSDIFVLFNIMNLDKSTKLYVSELDFQENARQLINRKFSII
jgi:hypothetical protein